MMFTVTILDLQFDSFWSYVEYSEFTSMYFLFQIEEFLAFMWSYRRPFLPFSQLILVEKLRHNFLFSKLINAIDRTWPVSIWWLLLFQFWRVMTSLKSVFIKKDWFDVGATCGGVNHVYLDPLVASLLDFRH